MLDEKYIRLQFVFRIIYSIVLIFYLGYLQFILLFDGISLKTYFYILKIIIILPLLFVNLIFPLIAKSVIKPINSKVITYRILMTITFLVDLLYILLLFIDNVVIHQSFLLKRSIFEDCWCIVWFIITVVSIYYTYRKKFYIKN